MSCAQVSAGMLREIGDPGWEARPALPQAASTAAEPITISISSRRLLVSPMTTYPDVDDGSQTLSGTHRDRGRPRPWTVLGHEGRKDVATGPKSYPEERLCVGLVALPSLCPRSALKLS